MQVYPSESEAEEGTHSAGEPLLTLVAEAADKGAEDGCTGEGGEGEFQYHHRRFAGLLRRL